MPRFHFALIDRTNGLTDRDLYSLKEALEANARHCAEAWGLQPAGVDVIHDVTRLPSWMVPVVFTDGGDDERALAAHTYDVIRGLPAARVHVPKASGLTSGNRSVLENAGHEILESMCNPMVNIWVARPGVDGHEVPQEVADPTQDTYRYQTRDGRWLNLANFVYPSWFDVRLVDKSLREEFLDRGGRFDHARRMTAPGELSNHGYTIVRARTASGLGYETWAEWGGQGGASLDRSYSLAANKHPWARTRRLGVALV